MLKASLLVCALFLACTPAYAEEEEEKPGWKRSEWAFQFSFYTRHFDPEPEHNNDTNLLGAEAHFENDWFVGAAFFDNSFDQASQFFYVGYTYDFGKTDAWFARLRGGLLHGYKEPYEDKIPLNSLGVAPAIVPSIGFRYKNFITEAQLAGLAAVTLTAGFQF